MSDTGSIGLARLNSTREPTEQDVQRGIDLAMRDVIRDVTDRIPKHNEKFGQSAGKVTPYGALQTKGTGWTSATELKSPYEGEHARLVMDAMIDNALGPPVRKHVPPPKPETAKAAVAEPKAEMETQSAAPKAVPTRRRSI